jgi:hypothetical protein
MNILDDGIGRQIERVPARHEHFAACKWRHLSDGVSAV